IIIYAYSQRIYSSRQIAKAVRENIPFMWLAARQRPDFRTINRFRSERMKDVLEKVFTAVLELLVEEGYIKLEHYFVDGTKIEA
ncbi:transposase, partial [Paenibacillus sp. 7541]